MAMQVVKQLFDVGELFNGIQDLNAVKEAYLESYRLENEWREGKHTLQEALADTKNVAIQLCCHDLDYENADAEIVKRLKRGINELRSHLVRDPFRETREAKIAAAKAYLLAEHIGGAVNLTNEQLAFDITTHLEFIKKTEIKDPPCLNRLKETVPEAFYYLALAMGA